MSEHSKGKWELRPNYGNLRSEIVAIDGNSTRAIATVWTKQASTREEQKEPVPWPEGEANARVMTAASLLLKAATRALNVLKAQGNTPQRGDVLDALQTAIAAATGSPS